MKSPIVLLFAAVALALAPSVAAAQTEPADSAAVTAAHADSSHASPSRVRRVRRNMSQLTSSELDSTHVSALYDAVARLRPRWLRNSRADVKAEGPADILVYRSTGQLLGNVEALRELVPTDVALIQWLDPVAARGRFGPRAENGAIVITDKT